MSHSPSSRKRKALPSGNSNNGQDDDGNLEQGNHLDVHSNRECPSSITAEDCTTLDHLLSVPLDIIFRQILTDTKNNEQQQGKPLLTRAEARCLLRISSLSQEWDLLMKTQTDSLQRSVWTKYFQQKILTGNPHGMAAAAAASHSNKSNSHPYLRPLIPILQVQGPHVTRQSLHLVDSEMQHIVEQLYQCKQSLRQFAEHNWTLSESLWDALGQDSTELNLALSQHDNSAELPKGALLAREKRRLSDLEQELCERMDALMVTLDAKPLGNDDDDEGQKDEEETLKQEHEKRKSQRGIESYDTSMATVCAQLWKLPMDLVEVGTVSDSGHRELQREQQLQPGLFSYPEPIQNQEQPYSTPLTMPALDDPSVQTKPQGVPNSSADMSDDDETVMDQPMMEDGQPPAAEESNSHSQQSHHSIVSNPSDQEDNDLQQQQQQQQEQQQELPQNVRAPTYSQVMGAGEALVLFACQQ
jgi:hypothetical protein